MIVDLLENIDRYSGDERLYRALCFARDFDEGDGNYEVEGRSIHAQCKSYLTKAVEEKSFENHREYIDVQVMLEGAEMMGHTLSTDLPPTGEYNAEKDVRKYARPETCSQVLMRPGAFVVFYPHDLHMPDCAIGKPERVRKLVVKVQA